MTWEDWERDYVRANYYRMRLEKVAAHLGRTEQAVQNMALKMGVLKPRGGSLPEFCVGCGRRVDRNTCVGWVDPSGCMGDFYATREQVAREEEERRKYQGTCKI